jgi:hypothetical protein
MTILQLNSTTDQIDVRLVRYHIEILLLLAQISVKIVLLTQAKEDQLMSFLVTQNIGCFRSLFKML